MMRNASSKPNRNHREKGILDELTDIVQESILEIDSEEGDGPPAFQGGRIGSPRGGDAGKDSLSDAERKTIAKKSAIARWKRRKSAG